MDNSLFYINFEPDDEQRIFIERVKAVTTDNIDPFYVVKKPVIEKKSDYEYEGAFVILVPKHKMMFFDFGKNNEMFDEYVSDFIEDIGYIAKKYEFLKLIGRPRQWKEDFVVKISKKQCKESSFDELLKENCIKDVELIRKGEILISLATGSINEAERLGEGIPDNVLDQIKRKIILFDGEQTKFVFDEPAKKRITIQGLAGTGKTELLLHKIKELYISSEENRIVFTCHNEILADSLRKRVPEFFNFMKVEEQIKWNERLWVMRSWGTQTDCNSGVYSYICHYYSIPFSRFSYNTTFDSICKTALYNLSMIEDFECCFDYILIDESQDFSDGFFKLCEKVSRKCVYVAGDIFQDIFENKSLSVVNPDFLLNKCYRTDPRTLMGAHAIGMGLFENKLRWLKDEEWEACGYDIRKENGIVELHRKPLKRFEDIDIDTTNGIELCQVNDTEYLETTLNIIDEIRRKNPTAAPDDIGIMFMENIEKNYKLASQLQFLIKEKFNWDVNIGYETKEKRKGMLFISNRNNVKGLEFPFVICIMQGELTDDFQIRNSVYMMLTRSFLTSYFVVPLANKSLDKLMQGIKFVNRKGFLKVTEPSEEEKAKLYNAIINRKNVHKSQYELVEEIMDELGISKKDRKKMHKIVEVMCSKETDREKLYDVIQTNYALME
ncbi:MAG: AAA family ATPase [Lachnospiraceae bacterium]|nr:AAA family ATPase [Lachnospiraceae bacterium]